MMPKLEKVYTRYLKGALVTIVTAQIFTSVQTSLPLLEWT
jgi:hypothetical protein